MVTAATSVMPTQASNPTATWTKMVQAALNERNKYKPGTPEYQKYNQLYISRAQHLRSLTNPQAPTSNPTTQPQPRGSITPISQQPSIVNQPLPQFQPIQPRQTFQPVSTRPPISNTILPAPSTRPPIQPTPVSQQVIPTPRTTPIDSTILPGDTAQKPPDPEPRPTPDPNPKPSTTPDPNKPTPEDVASEGQNLEFDFKNRELTLNNQFRYYSEQNRHAEEVANLQGALKQMRLDFEIQGRQLDNESTQILGDLENRAAEIGNQFKLGMSDLDAQKAIAQLEADVQQQLGNKGLDVDLSKALAQIEAQTQTGLTQMYLDQEKAAGELGLQKQLGLTEMGLNAAGQLATNRSNERMTALNATGQMAPQMRQISSNERVSFGNMGANLANQSQAINAQRQAELMSMGLNAQQAMRQTETERQLGLTGQTMQGYATLAQMNQQPENWLSAFYAMRGMDTPQNAKTGQAQSLGQYLQQLSALGLGIDPNAVASGDKNANMAFNTGQQINPNMLNGDIGALTNNYNNAAFQGLGQERQDAENITRRMMDAGEFGRAQDANLIEGLSNRAFTEGIEGNNVLGQAGYDSQHMYNRLIPQLARSNYYNPPAVDQSEYDPAKIPPGGGSEYDNWGTKNPPRKVGDWMNQGQAFTPYEEAWNQQSPSSMMGFAQYEDEPAYAGAY